MKRTRGYECRMCTFHARSTGRSFSKGIREDLVKKMPFEERLEGGEEMSHVGIWETIFHAEAFSRNSKEASVADAM